MTARRHRHPPLRVEDLEGRATPAAAGALDPTFGGDGLVDVTASGAGQAVVVDPLGRVIVAGSVPGAGSDNDFLVERLNPDGTPDLSFGTGGRQVIDFGGNDVAYGVALDPAGDVVAAGVTGSNSAVVRLTPDGQPDPTFGAGGKVVISGNTTLAVTTDAAGRVVAAGAAVVGIAVDVAAYRLLPDGTFDPGFNGGAVKLVSFGAGTRAAAHGVALDGGGNVVVGADVEVGPDSNHVDHKMAAVRLTPAGDLDPTFGTGGMVAFHTLNRTAGYTVDYTRGVAADPAGRVYLTGYEYSAVPPVLTVARLTAAGTLDGSFGTGGVYAETRADSYASAVTLDAAGRVLVGGTVGGSGSGFAVLRLTPTGTPDPTFAPSGSYPGVAHVPGTEAPSVPGPGGLYLKGLALDRLGRIVVVGDVGGFPGGTGRVAAARLLGEATNESPRSLAAGGSPDGRAVVYAPEPATGRYATATTLAPFGNAGVALRTATADVNGDGVEDTVVVTGPGVPTRFAVVSGADRTTLLVPPTAPFAGSEDFAGGGFAAAADLDGDGRAEVVLTADRDGGPRVVVFSVNPGGALVLRANFYGVDDPAFRGGARPALGDVNADGVPDLAVAAGFLGGPRVAIFDGKTLSGTPTRLVGDFYAFGGSDADTLRNGVFVALGDVDGDGFADVIAGGGPGGGPRVLTTSGRTLLSAGVATAQASPLTNFFVAGNEGDRGGVRVAALNADGDNKADVAAGSGEGNPSRVRVYLGKNIIGTSEPSTFQDLDPFGATLSGGVFVG